MYHTWNTVLTTVLSLRHYVCFLCIGYSSKLFEDFMFYLSLMVLIITISVFSFKQLSDSVTSADSCQKSIS